VARTEMSEKKLLIITGAVIGGIVLVLLGLLYYFWFVKLGWNKETAAPSTTGSLRQQLKHYENETARLTNIKKQKGGIENELKNNREHVEKLETYLPEGLQIDELQIKLSEIGTKAELDIEKLSYAREKSKKETTTVPTPAARGKQQLSREEEVSHQYEKTVYSIKCKGSFATVGQFLSKIEAHKGFGRFLTVDKIKIKAADKGAIEDDGKQKHEVELDLATISYTKDKNDKKKIPGRP